MSVGRGFWAGDQPRLNGTVHPLRHCFNRDRDVGGELTESVRLDGIPASEPFGLRQALSEMIVLAGVIVGQRGDALRGRINPRKELIPFLRR